MSILGTFFAIQICVRGEVYVVIISYEKCNFRNLAASSFVVGIHPGATLPGRRRRFLSIKAEVNYVKAEEAKKLITVEGFSVLDVRDNTQFKRAHIKDCFHVPLFIENNDKDLGKKYILVFLTTFAPNCCIHCQKFSAGTIIKRTVHNNFSGLFFGLPFTKPNPDFVPSVKAQFSPESKLLLVCQEGLR